MPRLNARELFLVICQVSELIIELLTFVVLSLPFLNS